MKELQGYVERLQRAQMEKSRNLGKDVRDSSRVMQSIARNKGKDPVVLDDVDTPVDDELSSGSSPSLSLLLIKNARESTNAKSRKRPSPRPTFNDAISGASHRARREADRRQNRPNQAPGNPSVLPSSVMPPMPPVHLAFGVEPMFYMPPAALIRRPDDMLSSPLGQHILNYEPPRGFVIFITFDGSTNPYDHMLHYNQAMTLNADNDRMLCKVFLASLWGPVLAWFHKLSRYSINSFNELWDAFISQYLCLVRQKKNINSLQTILK